MIFIIVISYIIIGMFEIIPLIKSRDTKSIIIYNILFIIAFISSILLSLEVAIPNPLKPIETTIKFISGH